MSDQLHTFWDEQAKWSQEVFGPDSVRGPNGPTLHLAREVLTELLGIDRAYVDGVLRQSPGFGQHQTRSESLEELIDCQFLIIDAARRAGFSYNQFMDALFTKLAKNKAREWPQFDPSKVNEAVEHVRKDEK